MSQTEPRNLEVQTSTTFDRLAALPGKGLDTSEARKERIRFLREKTGAALSAIDDTRIPPERLEHNIESLVGEVPLPLGVVGPLLMRRDTGFEQVYVPLATTEGALVASANRGVTAISRSGGALSQSLEQRMTRTPTFVFEGIHDAMVFSDWIETRVDMIRECIRPVSRHAHLLYIQPELLGRQVHLHFVYRTGDAAGQNMVTACTWSACQWICAAVEGVLGAPARDFYVEGGLSNDKRASARGFSEGRGMRVTAEACLRGDIVRRVLKVEPQRLLSTYRVWSAGHQAAGNLGGGIHIANAMAAIFAATGQDIACVHESSIGVMYLEEEGNDGVYVSLTLPSLVVGTVGGGTGLPHQKECLTLMDCAGPGKVSRLAEIVTATAMGLEVSLLAAVSAGHFAEAHERMGRNRPPGG